jgi:AraC family transcriptional regulator
VSKSIFITGTSSGLGGATDSSDSDSCDSALVEHHWIPKGERPETTSDQHILWLWSTSLASEYVGRGGRFVRCCKGPGAITVTPVGLQPTLHSYTNAEAISCAMNAHFVRNVLSELDRRPSAEPFFRPNLQESAIRRLITLLLDEVRAGAPSGKLYTDSLTHALAIRYLQLGERVPDSRVHPRVSALPSYALKRVLERIEHSFQSEISLASLAEEAGYSRGHFLKMFRMSTGTTPHRYVLQRRIEHARSLLKRRAIKIIDIASECGFSSQAHLTQVFREYVGVTPAEYRRIQ